MPSPYYPDDIRPYQLCYMEGCAGEGRCPNCGKTNYHLLGYSGAIARWAKAWGITKKEAEQRITQHQLARLEEQDAKQAA